MTEHRPDCQRTGWTETTSRTGTKTWRCNDCGATSIPTTLALVITDTIAGKTIEQGIDDLTRLLRIPDDQNARAVSVSADPVRQERPARMRSGHTSCTHGVFAQVRDAASDSVSAVKGAR